jgi:iron complex transport system ATP-binding protein
MDIDLRIHINTQQIHCHQGLYILIGENGSGKSSLLRSLIALPSKMQIDHQLKIQSQEIEIKNDHQRARFISYLPQNPSYSHYQNVFNCVLQGKYAIDQSEAQKRIEIQNLLDRFDLYALQDKRLGEISGGERQRVFIARTIAQNSQVILMDEPTNHLDFYQQVKLLQYLQALAQNHLVLCVLHDLNLSFLYADQIILMKDLSVKIMGTAKEVIQSDVLKECFGPSICSMPHPIYENKYQIYYG